jgi:plastocyanin
MIKHFAAILCISAGLLTVSTAQMDPAGRPPGVAHGVSSQFEKVDNFPYYDTHTIRVGNGVPFYTPAEITVRVGDAVRWLNDPLSDTHTVIDANGRFTSRGIPARQDFCYHFVQEGDYSYSCRFHPWMKGVVHVHRRELSLHPLVELAEGPELLQRAEFLAANREAIEDGKSGFWLPGMQLATLDHRSSAQATGESLAVGETGGRLVPLAVSGGRLMVAAYNELLVLDAASGKTLDRFSLPRETNLVRGAALADGQIWAVSYDGKTLLFADAANKIIRTRMLADDARIVAIRSGAPGSVWAADAGRKMLLKLGADWITEIPLPTTINNLNSVAVDAEGHAWFADPGTGIVGTVVASGLAAEFSIPVETHAELFQLAGRTELLLSSAAGEGRIDVVREDLGHLVSGLQKDSNCEAAPGSDMKQTSSVIHPEERKQQ